MPEVPPHGMRERVIREGRRRRARLAGGLLGVPAVLAVAAVVVVPTLGGEDRLLPAAPTTSTAAPTPAASPAAAAPCPETLRTAQGDLSVPAPPGEDLAGALVPGEPPLAVTTCRYGDASLRGFGQGSAPPDEVDLEDTAVLRGGFAQVPADLGVPAGSGFGFCTQIGGPIYPYLVQLQYPDRTVWLRTAKEANSCELVTNGAFTSATYFGDQVDASHRAGAWVPPPPPPWNARPADNPCPRDPVGRAGQERDFVPAGWQRVVVCETRDQTQTVRPLEDAPARSVVELLNSLPATLEQGYGASCDDPTPVEGDVGQYVSLVIEYPKGRNVEIVLFLACEPPISNGSQSGAATPAQQAELLRLVGAAG